MRVALWGVVVTASWLAVPGPSSGQSGQPVPSARPEKPMKVKPAKKAEPPKKKPEKKAEKKPAKKGKAKK